MRKILILLPIAVVFLVMGCGTTQDQKAAETTAVPVIAVAPTVKDITLYLESIGTLQPDVSMEIRPQASGKLSQVFVTEGQNVQKGTPLFVVDTKPYAIKVEEAEAHLIIDRADLHTAEKKLNRFKDLAEKDLVSKSEWDVLEAQVQKSQAAVALDTARLHGALLDLELCTLKSPIEGRVGKLDAHPGLLVANGQPIPLVTVSKIDPLIVEFTVTEKDFPKLPKGNLEFEMQGLCSSEPCKKGMITFLDNQFDSKTGLLLIRGRVENSDFAMRPGQSIRVLIPIDTKSNVKTIPQKAIRYSQEGPYVYVVQADQTIAIRPLILGEEHGTDQVVKEGLDSVEMVITDGHLRLYPGLKVEVKS